MKVYPKEYHATARNQEIKKLNDRLAVIRTMAKERGQFIPPKAQIVENGYRREIHDLEVMLERTKP